jgi:hypothetical protein
MANLLPRLPPAFTTDRGQTKAGTYVPALQKSRGEIQFTDDRGVHPGIRGRRNDLGRRRSDHGSTGRTTRGRTRSIRSGQEGSIPEERRPPAQRKPLRGPDTPVRGRYRLERCKPGPEPDRQLEEPQSPEPVKEVKAGQS